MSDSWRINESSLRFIRSRLSKMFPYYTYPELDKLIDTALMCAHREISNKLLNNTDELEKIYGKYQLQNMLGLLDKVYHDTATLDECVIVLQITEWYIKNRESLNYE